MRPWHAVTRGEYKLWTNARGTTLFTAARRTPARTIEPGHPLRKTRPDETVESKWDEEEDATKTKMTNVECNVIPINLEPHTRLCLVTQSTEIQVLGMAKKKKNKMKRKKFSAVYCNLQLSTTLKTTTRLALSAIIEVVSLTARITSFQSQKH